MVLGIDRCVTRVLLGGSTIWAAWVVILLLCILAQHLFPENNMLASVVAGAMTGVVETLLMFPIENLKTQQQLTFNRAAPVGSGGNASFAQVARRTWRLQGARGFYRGMAPVLFCAVPNQALRWTSFDVICSLTSCLADGGLWSVALAGVGSGIVVAAITGVPVETAKTQAIHSAMLQHTHLLVPDEDSDIDPLEGLSVSGALAARLHRSPRTPGEGGRGASRFPQQHQHDGFVVVNVPTSVIVVGAAAAGHGGGSSDMDAGGVALAVVDDKSRSVLRGWLPTIIKKVGNQGVRFPVHRALLNYMCGSTHLACDAAKNPMFGFIAGALAGMSSILVTQPVDVVKTRMQGLGADRYGHSWSCAWHLLREEGAQVFLHGMGARALRSGLGAGFSFAFFPVVKALLVA